MKIQCDYCGNTYEDTLKQCPNCGAPNPSHNDGDKKPRTIEELQKWYQDRKLPPENVTRFFIGKDIKESKAFGIYRDENGDFVVYKNKADGTRAVRYQGKDESYAVNELYQKLKDEIVHQKTSSQSRAKAAENKAISDAKLKKSIKRAEKTSNRSLILGVIFLLVFLIYSNWSVANANKYNGYYNYKGSTYYRYADDWYIYDDDYDSYSYSDYDSWGKVYDYDVPEELEQSKDDYYLGNTWNPDISSTNFEDSSWYQEIQERESSSDSYDNDYDWSDNDSWDSDSTDWDSDW